MMQVRPIKELLELLLDYYSNNKIDHIDDRGLCKAYVQLLEFKVINRYEASDIEIYIRDNRPENTFIEFLFWPEGEKQPRIEFLKKLISEL